MASHLIASPEPPGRESESAGTRPTLVVDLDGTLTTTDTLFESVLLMARQHPFDVLRIPLWLSGGPATLKSRVAERVNLDVASLPWNTPLLDYLRGERAAGRRIVLATAAHRSIAQAVARHLGVFDDVLHTDGQVNLKGATKLGAIQRQVSPDFVYAGDSAADLAVWQGATGAVLVNTGAKVSARARQLTPVEREFTGAGASLRTWGKALRVHQWAKNVLLFVPLLTAFSFLDLGKVAAALLAFVAFCLSASSTYLLNDLWDLASDRAHPRKRERPIASGRISIPAAIAASALLLISGVAVAALVSTSFMAALGAYLVLTTAYSWALKRYVVLDAVSLSLLYTLRIVAGALAIGAVMSSWLLAYSVFVFLSLALVKRCTELMAMHQLHQSATRGRDYRVDDLVVLWPLGVGASLAAVVVFGLFISASETTQRYGTPQLLWLVAVMMIYWLARLWIKTSRGEMHDDPVVYALRDRGSRLTLLAMTAAVLVSRFVELGPR